MSKKSKKRKKLQYLKQYQQLQIQKDGFDDMAFWTKIIVAISLLVYIFLIPPFLKSGIMSGHDIGAHYIYFDLFKTGLSQGQIPVRMIDWVVPGFNQPLFNYYQPGFYYLAQVLADLEGAH